MRSQPNRGRYQGVLQILQFNSPKYCAAGAGILVAALAWPLVTTLNRWILMLVFVPVAFWMVSSLLVSHYVYDQFPLFDFRYFASILSRVPYRWISIHSGWDETSERLSEIFPGSKSEIVDIFDAQVMTESSIRLARRMNHSAVPSTSAKHDELPFRSGSFEAAFSIFAAHELRCPEQRVGFFIEIARVLSAEGEFVLMEHLRDWPNFLAFGPGFLHFFSHSEWIRTASQAGMKLQRGLRMTPFVHVYIFRRIP